MSVLEVVRERAIGGRDTTENGALGGSGAPSWDHTWRGNHDRWGSKGWQAEDSWDETRNRTGTSWSGSANDPWKNWATAEQRDLPVAAVSLNDRAAEDRKPCR